MKRPVTYTIASRKPYNPLACHTEARSRISNFSYPRPISSSAQQHPRKPPVDRDSVRSDSSAPGLIEDHGSDMSADDDHRCYPPPRQPCELSGQVEEGNRKMANSLATRQKHDIPKRITTIPVTPAESQQCQAWPLPVSSPSHRPQLSPRHRTRASYSLFPPPEEAKTRPLNSRPPPLSHMASASCSRTSTPEPGQYRRIPKPLSAVPRKTNNACGSSSNSGGLYQSRIATKSLPALPSPGIREDDKRVNRGLSGQPVGTSGNLPYFTPTVCRSNGYSFCSASSTQPQPPQRQSQPVQPTCGEPGSCPAPPELSSHVEPPHISVFEADSDDGGSATEHDDHSSRVRCFVRGLAHLHWDHHHFHLHHHHRHGHHHHQDREPCDKDKEKERSKSRHHRRSVSVGPLESRHRLNKFPPSASSSSPPWPPGTRHSRQARSDATTSTIADEGDDLVTNYTTAAAKDEEHESRSPPLSPRAKTTLHNDSHSHHHHHWAWGHEMLDRVLGRRHD